MDLNLKKNIPFSVYFDETTKQVAQKDCKTLPQTIFQ